MRMSLAAMSALLVLAVSLLSWAQPARADVVYTEVLKGPRGADGSGPPVESQVYLNGKALRREAQSAQDSGPPSEYFSSTTNSAYYPRLEILRLDQNLLWSKSASGVAEKQPMPRYVPPAKARLARMADLADLQIISSQPVLRRTGFKKKVNDHMCDHIFAVVTCEARDKSTGQTGTLVLMNDLWVAEDVPGTDEIRGFRRSLGQLYGMKEYFCPDAALFADALPEQAAQMGELMSQVKGLPVSTMMTAKFRKKLASGKSDTELLYSLTTDIMDVENIAYNPNVYELPR